MAHENFEVPFAVTEFHIDHFEAHIHEGLVGPTPPLPAPTGIIRTDQDWTLHIHWHTEGALVPILRGYWHLDMYLESVGPGPELRLPVGDGVDEPLTPGPSPVIYDFFITIPAGTVPAGPAGHPRPYKLVTTVCYKYCEDGPIGLMSGFVEGPVIQFYTP